MRKSRPQTPQGGCESSSGYEAIDTGSTPVGATNPLHRLILALLALKEPMENLPFFAKLSQPLIINRGQRELCETTRSRAPISTGPHPETIGLPPHKSNVIYRITDTVGR